VNSYSKIEEENMIAQQAKVIVTHPLQDYKGLVWFVRILIVGPKLIATIVTTSTYVHMKDVLNYIIML